MGNWQRTGPTMGAQRSGILEGLEKVLEVDPSGNRVKLKTPGGSIELGPNGVTIHSKSSISIESNANITVTSRGKAALDGNETSIRGLTNLHLSANAHCNIQAGAMCVVKGSIVKLGPGAKPVARVGDHIAGNSIISGNPTVLG